jgi:hypothetical protein
MGSAQLDIRLPMGIMFCVIGAVIAVYGAFTNNSSMYDDHSLGININLWWGTAILLFGLLMLALMWKSRQTTK